MLEPIKDYYALLSLVSKAPLTITPLSMLEDKIVSAVYDTASKEISIRTIDQQITFRINQKLILGRKTSESYYIIKGDALSAHMFFADLKDLGIIISKDNVPEILQYGIYTHSIRASIEGVYGLSIKNETDRVMFHFHYGDKMIDIDKLKNVDLDDQYPDDWEKREYIKDFLSVIESTI